MEINGTSSGAALYALKKALDMPKAALDLVNAATGSAGQGLTTTAPEAQAVDRAAATGKGQIVDLVA